VRGIAILLFEEIELRFVHSIKNEAFHFFSSFFIFFLR